jgi:hypothetical protein
MTMSMSSRTGRMLSAIWSIPFGQYRKLPDLETADFAGSDFAQADQNSISLEAARWREEDSSSILRLVKSCPSNFLRKVSSSF